MAEEDMLAVREAAARLRLNEETVRRWLLAGKLRGTKLGPTKAGWRIPATEIQRVLTGTPALSREDVTFS